jgi:hypothetical protein
MAFALSSVAANPSDRSTSGVSRTYIENMLILDVGEKNSEKKKYLTSHQTISTSQPSEAS